MIELPHDLDFLDQALFSIFFTVGGFFGEGLDGIVLMVVKFLDKINRGKIALSNLLDGFELLMKSFLVEVNSKNFFPLEFILFGELQN